MIGVSWGLLFSKLWNTIPGASELVSKYDFGLMGACAILGGIQPSSISLVVILLEGTGQARYLLAIMLTTITAKSVSALIEEGVYEVAIELKKMPYLDMNQTGRWMHGLTAQNMCGHQRGAVSMLYYCVRVEELLQLLESNAHNGFPVISPGGQLKGIALRSQLYSLLEHKRFKSSVDTPSRKSFTQVELEALQVPSRYTADATITHIDLDFSELQVSFEITDQEMKLWVDVAEVMNHSPYTVLMDCPMKRVVRLFCKLGLRHLVVLDSEDSKVSGIITRHDILDLQETQHEHH